MRSIVYVGRELMFPIDTEMLLTPTLNPDNNQLLFKYLQDMSMNAQLAISVFKILI